MDDVKGVVNPRRRKCTSGVEKLIIEYTEKCEIQSYIKKEKTPQNTHKKYF